MLNGSPWQEGGGLKLGLLCPELGAFHSFRETQKCPSAAVPLAIQADSLQKSGVAMSAPPAALPACLISGSCDVQ